MDLNSKAYRSNDLVVVETDSEGRYIRYNKIIGKGAWKKVYLGFDMVVGIETAWIVTALTKRTKWTKISHEMCAEGDLLKSLEHDNILRCYHSWIINDVKNMVRSIHITELFTSGNLIDYGNKHNLANNKQAIKTLARQILRGLHYLHTHSPRIIHGDIKCENIFVNGNTGSVKLGNFGFATVLEQEISETPGFTALVTQGPNNPVVDIFSFGMCILQMVTRELPYFSHDGKPAALSRVADPEVKRFIEMCLADESERPTAIGLLNDQFLATTVSGTLTARCCLSIREFVLNPASFISWIVLLCQEQQNQEQEQRGESENQV